MAIPNRVIVVCLALVLKAPVVHAQACLGLPSFARGAIHVNLSGEFPDSATAYAVGIGAGRHESLFGNIGGGQVKYEGLDGATTLGFLEVGLQLPAGRAQICPVAGGYVGRGPNDETFGLEISSRGASAGIAIGLPLAMGAFGLIPNAAVRYEVYSTKVVEEGFDSERSTGRSGIFDLGLALVLSERFSVQPLAHVPFDIQDGKVSFGVFASVALPIF